MKTHENERRKWNNMFHVPEDIILFTSLYEEENGNLSPSIKSNTMPNPNACAHDVAIHARATLDTCRASWAISNP